MNKDFLADYGCGLSRYLGHTAKVMGLDVPLNKDGSDLHPLVASEIARRLNVASVRLDVSRGVLILTPLAFLSTIEITITFSESA